MKENAEREEKKAPLKSPLRAKLAAMSPFKQVKEIKEAKAVAEKEMKSPLKSPLRRKLEAQSPFRNAGVSSPFKQISAVSFMNNRLWQHGYGHLKSKQRSKYKAKLNDYISKMRKAADGWHEAASVELKRAAEEDFLASSKELRKASASLMRNADSTASIKAAIAPVAISDVIAEWHAMRVTSPVVTVASIAPLSSKECVESKEPVAGKE